MTPAKPSRVAVLAVDEGILQVARYKNPDPLALSSSRSGCSRWRRKQILDLILPEFKRFLALAAPGGDADGGFARHLNPFNRKRKPPVAYWSGIVDVGPAGREFRTPCPTTSTAGCASSRSRVSARRDGRRAKARTEVKGDFILTPNVPAMVAPGDEFMVSVGVFNNTTGGNGPIRLEAQRQPRADAAQARPSVDLQIADKKEGVGEFRIKANARARARRR